MTLESELEKFVEEATGCNWKHLYGYSSECPYCQPHINKLMQAVTNDKIKLLEGILAESNVIEPGSEVIAKIDTQILFDTVVQKLLELKAK